MVAGLQATKATPATNAGVFERLSIDSHWQSIFVMLVRHGKPAQVLWFELVYTRSKLGEKLNLRGKQYAQLWEDGSLLHRRLVLLVGW